MKRIVADDETRVRWLPTGLLHIGLASVSPVAWYFSYAWWTGRGFQIGEDWQSFVNVTLVGVGFIIGFAFAGSSPFPFRGWVGYSAGWFAVCMYDMWPWWNWFPVAMFVAVMMAVSPSAGELLGIGFGKVIRARPTRHGR